jgi:hypothetical protein
MDKKVLKEEYKQRKISGGIYRVVNTRNGKYVFGYAVDIQAKQNSFNFLGSSGACRDPRAVKDWQTFGNGVFSFEVLETLEKKKDQTQEQFIEDLETLAGIWDEKLGKGNRY